MAADDLEIVSMMDTTDLDRNGKRRDRKRVVWNFAGHGPFTDYFPVENFDGAGVRQQLQLKGQREVAALINKR